jgi:hypothetical protein
MRTLRLSLVGTVILMLLGGLAGTVVAQDEGDTEQVLITPFRGTITASRFDDSDEEYWVDPDGARHARGARHEETYEWDDDRLPSLKRMAFNFDMYPNEGSGDVWILTGTVRMDGPEGYWEGTGHFFGPVDGSASAAGIYAGSQDILVGHGAYEGLLAVMGCDASTGCSGYIAEGELPPLPDPVEPLAE